MNERVFDLIEKLKKEKSLTLAEYEYLLVHRSKEAAELLAKYAQEARSKFY